MEHSFSVELKSKEYVKNMSISDEAHGQVLIEGNLGELLELSIVEGDVLEFTCVYGVLRIDVLDEQLHHILFLQKMCMVTALGYFYHLLCHREVYTALLPEQLHGSE